MRAQWIKHALILLSIAFTTSVTLASEHFSDLNIKRMIILGDSLSDNGNDFLLTTQLHARFPAIPIIPNASLYWQGRFSDGPTWPEYLTGMLHTMPEHFQAENRKSDFFINLAYGGAWAQSDTDEISHQRKLRTHLFPPALEAQMETYLINTVTIDPEHYQDTLAHDLVFVWIGGNDYLSEARPDGPTPGDPAKISNQVIAAIQDNLVKLIESGVKNLVLMGLPDLSKVPDIYLRDPEGKSFGPIIAKMSELHNKKLQQLQLDLIAKYPDVKFTYLDVEQLFEDEFVEAKLRQQTYALLHQGVYQKMLSPCLLDTSDPDPTIINVFGVNRMLRLTRSSTKLRNEAYRNCDLHEVEDESSSFNFLTHYTAGGIFFDHIHPITQMHAKIAFRLCHLLANNGYHFYQPEQKRFTTFNCDQYKVDDLVLRTEDPPFPAHNK